MKGIPFLFLYLLNLVIFSLIHSPIRSFVNLLTYFSFVRSFLSYGFTFGYM